MAVVAKHGGTTLGIKDVAGIFSSWNFPVANSGVHPGHDDRFGTEKMRGDELTALVD